MMLALAFYILPIPLSDLSVDLVKIRSTLNSLYLDPKFLSFN